MRLQMPSPSQGMWMMHKGKQSFSLHQSIPCTPSPLKALLTLLHPMLQQIQQIRAHIWQEQYPDMEEDMKLQIRNFYTRESNLKVHIIQFYSKEYRKKSTYLIIRWTNLLSPRDSSVSCITRILYSWNQKLIAVTNPYRDSNR